MTDPVEANNIDSTISLILDQMQDCASDADITAVLERNADALSAAADECKKTRAWVDASSRLDALKIDFEANCVEGTRLSAAWKWLMSCVVEAPTRSHVKIMLRMYIPFVVSYLPLRNGEQVGPTTPRSAEHGK